MLKFVTTKPPRGRSPSGSTTPDRDIPYRMPAHEPPASFSKPQYSPRVTRKTSSHPDSRVAYVSPPSSSSSISYRPPPSFSGRHNVPALRDSTRKYGDSSSQIKYLKHQDHQHYQRQPRQQRYTGQQQQQQPWSHTKYAYKQATPSESPGTYATLHFKEPEAEVFSSSLKENKFPLEIAGLYTTKHIETATHQRPKQTQPEPKTYQAPRYTGVPRDTTGSMKITPDRRLQHEVDLYDGPDYDLAKAIPGSGESTPRSDGSKSVQYVVNEIVSKHKGAGPYFPSPRPHEEAYRTQFTTTEHLQRSLTPKQGEYPQVASTQSSELLRNRTFSGISPESQQVMSTCVPQVTNDL
ncbi:unnamed protein product, partial [Candidula unifasciata]